LMGELDLTMATCLLAIVDVDRLELRWSRAGHPPPLLLRDGRHAYLDSGEGVLLGIGAGWAPATATLVLEPGDALVLFTDGLIERRTESLTDGLDRLAQVALGLGTSDPERLCQGIVDELLPPGQGRKDDVAILVARVSGTV
jgi:serine phosphatase RsbU (regulator of sigma subunit)